LIASYRQLNDEKLFQQDYRMLNVQNKEVVRAIVDVLLKNQKTKTKTKETG